VIVPIPLPDLDDRTWADLVAELRAQLPQTAPDWTDHNVSDPGITLLELYAWISEMLMFRLGRVPQSTSRSFLRHFGIELRPPAVARTVVAVRLPPLAPAIRISAGQLVTDPAGEVRFSTTEPIDLSPAWLEQSPGERTSRGVLIARGSGQVTNVTQTNRTQDGAFFPFGRAPHDGDSLELGFDRAPAPPGVRARLHVWTQTWVDDLVDQPVLRSMSSDWTRHPGIETIWEYWAGALGWRSVAHVDDQTRGLTFSGPVTLAGLDDHRPGPRDGLYRVRCRIVSGASEYRPTLRRIAINAVPAENAVVEVPGPLATSRGDAGQTYLLGHAPVVAGSLRLNVGGDPEPWLDVSDWDRSGPFDRHVRLDPERGIVEFGDGRTGFVPAAGEAITVSAVRVGGGLPGNVAAGTLQRIGGIAAVVVQPHDASGGSPAESLGHARGRLVDRLATPQRGITANDLELLAIQVPGLAVRRARAVPEQHPAYPGLTVPGAVSLVVLTANSTASAAVVQAAQDWLDPRRPVGCELHVTAPSWRPVSVHATLLTDSTSGAELDTVAQAALDHFFHPLTGGPDGTGWPFGRDVFRTEVAAVLADVPGVARVVDLDLFGTGDSPTTCANLPLCSTDLVRSLPHVIHIVEA
jgi:predicted phage baseplate assembly protein